MTGQRNIIEMRRSGLAPSYVWVSDFPDAILDGLTVRIAGDTPELEDLRFLVGTTAIVESADPARLERITTACTKHAKRVIASLHAGRDVVQITDTEGTMTWPT